MNGRDVSNKDRIKRSRKRERTAARGFGVVSVSVVRERETRNGIEREYEAVRAGKCVIGTRRSFSSCAASFKVVVVSMEDAR